LIEFTMSKVAMVISGAVVVALMVTTMGGVNSTLEDDMLRMRLEQMAETIEGMESLVPGSHYRIETGSLLEPTYELRLGNDYLRLVTAERTITIMLSQPIALTGAEGKAVQELVATSDDALILLKTDSGVEAHLEKVPTSFSSI